jgi:predicted aspartyl protease
MGTFFAEVQLASPARPDRRELVKLLVDSGSMYTWVSGALLRELGVEPSERRRVLTIEGRTTERRAAEIMITLEGRTSRATSRFSVPTRWKGSGSRSTPFSGVSSRRFSTAP